MHRAGRTSSPNAALSACISCGDFVGICIARCLIARESALQLQVVSSSSLGCTSPAELPRAGIFVERQATSGLWHLDGLCRTPSPLRLRAQRMPIHRTHRGCCRDFRLYLGGDRSAPHARSLSSSKGSVHMMRRACSRSAAFVKAASSSSSVTSGCPAGGQRWAGFFRTTRQVFCRPTSHTVEAISSVRYESSSAHLPSVRFRRASPLLGICRQFGG